MLKVSELNRPAWPDETSLATIVLPKEDKVLAEAVYHINISITPHNKVWVEFRLEPVSRNTYNFIGEDTQVYFTWEEFLGLIHTEQDSEGNALPAVSKHFRQTRQDISFSYTFWELNGALEVVMKDFYGNEYEHQVLNALEFQLLKNIISEKIKER